MEKYAPKFSKVLVTPDPHYIPGYGGYCPQLKYNMGKSYGKLTAELLRSPEVNHSPQLVLQTGHPHFAEPDTGRVLPDSNIRTMVPGYTGFIPKKMNYFACSYSETCRKALSEFYQDHYDTIQRRSARLPVIFNHTNVQPTPPLTAINDVVRYQPVVPFTPPEKPYSMDDNNPQKYFVSGFTGHVPKSRFLFGKGYPITTNQALIQFGSRLRNKPPSRDMVERRDNTTAPFPAIYPQNRGVVPSFAGHIPGYKFMYGHTFGQLSQNALEKSGIRRTLEARA
uniref:Ciliary microtubule inner protein 2B n=1 Tax=Sphaeramia orbicularis TaxID=375764 RepID=A0A673A8M4_9TELE